MDTAVINPQALEKEEEKLTSCKEADPEITTTEETVEIIKMKIMHIILEIARGASVLKDIHNVVPSQISNKPSAALKTHEIFEMAPLLIITEPKGHIFHENIILGNNFPCFREQNRRRFTCERSRIRE